MSVEKFNSKTEITKELVPFTQVNRNVIQNFKDVEAGFVWVYLLSMPSDWTIIKEQLKNHFNFGDNKIKKIFSTLAAHNLIRYEKIIDEKNNQVLKWVIHVLNGINFIQVPEKIKKSYPQSTGSISRRVEIQTSGKVGTTDKIYNKDNKIKNKERGELKFALSDFLNKPYPFTQCQKDLLRSKNLDDQIVFKKFVCHWKGKKKNYFTENDIENWVLREVEYASKRKSGPVNASNRVNPDRNNSTQWSPPRLLSIDNPRHPSYETFMLMKKIDKDRRAQRNSN